MASAGGQGQSQQVALIRQQTDDEDDEDDPVMNALVRGLNPLFEEDEDGPSRGLPDLRDLDSFFEDSPVVSILPTAARPVTAVPLSVTAQLAMLTPLPAS